jgi:hypothetical protein
VAAFATELPVILIVEYEFLLRTATADVIGDSGFEVLEAVNADDAIEIPLGHLICVCGRSHACG